MSDRPDPLRSTTKPDITESTSRKEDYKAYAERDIDDGWPYSDEPGHEEDRLEDNRPYASEDDGPLSEDDGAEGFHLEESPDLPLDERRPEDGDRDETVEDYLADQDDRIEDDDAPADKSADPETDPRPR